MDTTTTTINNTNHNTTNHSSLLWDILVAEKREYDLKWFGKTHNAEPPPCILSEKYKTTEKNEIRFNYEIDNLLNIELLSRNPSAIPFLEKNQELIDWRDPNDVLKKIGATYPSLYPENLSFFLDEFKKEVITISPEYGCCSPFLFDPKIIKLLKKIDLARFPTTLHEGHPFNHMKWAYLIETVKNRQAPAPTNDLEAFLMQRLYTNPAFYNRRSGVRNSYSVPAISIHLTMYPVSRPEDLSSFLDEFNKDEIRISPAYISRNPLLFHPEIVEILKTIDLARFPTALLYEGDIHNRKKWEYIIKLVQNPVFSEPPKNAIEEDIWSDVCSNPGAMNLLRQNTEFIDWLRLSQNPSAIDLLRANPAKVSIGFACSNPNIHDLFE